jgi:NAD(P)-dependent dehydrogenase (short-subunit alcohol dehydrogenase family)
MHAQGSGAIVNCSSLGGLLGLPGRAAYHASKYGVIGLTKSAELEYASRAVRIIALCPGTIGNPCGGNAPERDHAGSADRSTRPIGRDCRGRLLALQPGGSFVLGVALPVDGGFTAH